MRRQGHDLTKSVPFKHDRLCLCPGEHSHEKDMFGDEPIA